MNLRLQAEKEKMKMKKKIGFNSTTMVDWATLPQDLLELISKSLQSSSLYLIQFRSVCSSWRAATSEPKRLLPLHEFPILADKNGGRSIFPDSAIAFRLSQLSILLIKPYELTDSIGWVVKVEEDVHILRKLTLVDPLTDNDGFHHRHLVPRGFSGVLDMSKFKVSELGREYYLHYLDTDGRIKDSPKTLKTLVKYLDSDKFVLLTILNSGDLALFTSWDQTWTVINDNDMPCCCFCDVVLFNGRFFAVERNGRTVVVDFSSLKLTLVASPVFGGDYKLLVESSDEMLLVDMYLGIEFDSVSLSDFEEEDILSHDGVFNNEITRKINVFRFVERDKTWVEVKDLGDKMLFLGDESTFSASASDFLPFYGASVFFHGFVFDWEDLDTMDDEDFGVCDFKSGKIKLVSQHREYAKLFWPPPPWITQAN